jgi:hypothetical protein
MSVTSILIWLAVIWVGLGVLGAALHVIKALVWVALVATAAVLLIGLVTRRSGPG